MSHASSDPSSSKELLFLACHRGAVKANVFWEIGHFERGIFSIKLDPCGFSKPRWCNMSIWFNMFMPSQREEFQVPLSFWGHCPDRWLRFQSWYALLGLGFLCRWIVISLGVLCWWFRDSRIAQLAASPGYHYTMVLDSDTVCPAKSIRKLLETAEHSANQLLSSTSSSKNCFESVGILLKIGVFWVMFAGLQIYLWNGRKLPGYLK